MAFVVRRKEGEQIDLVFDGAKIATLTINAINGRNVELSFDAMDDLDIIRPEANGNGEAG